MLGIKIKLILMHLLEKLLSCSSALRLFNRAVTRTSYSGVFVYTQRKKPFSVGEIFLIACWVCYSVTKRLSWESLKWMVCAVTVYTVKPC